MHTMLYNDTFPPEMTVIDNGNRFLIENTLHFHTQKKTLYLITPRAGKKTQLFV